MHRSTFRRAALVAVTSGLLLIPAGAAFAHGDAKQGDLEMEIGFFIEPAFVGSPNGVFLNAVHDGQPVTDIAPGDMTARVTFGDETSDPLDFLPVSEGEPGSYVASFVPSQPGAYTFHLEGTIDGEEVDQTMSSGPKTFDTVESLTDNSFPPVTAPSNDELATRIARGETRTEDAVVAAQAAAASADDAASSARTIAVIGVILGAIGIIAAVAAIASSRRKA
jgi:hypothetical protein